MEKKNWLHRLKNIGPGAIVVAAFIGPGTITVCSSTGQVMDILYCGCYYLRQLQQLFFRKWQPD